MTTRTLGCWLALSAMLVNLTAPAWGQVAAPPPPPATLWSFLGIPQAFKAVREGAINKSGNHPALEKKPPLKKIADPENLKSENPAIKKAAEIKKEEDLKWQKIKAIKYLTTIGCGCYNRDGSITDALMKAMDDCTEEVRYATILAVNGAANGEMCENCKMRSCCSEEVSNKLYELAYERDDEGCFLEPSERVRLAAAEALRACCPGSGDDFFFEGAPIGETPPDTGERPGVVPLPGGERPIDPPPPLPGQPTPALPMPPVPTPELRPISESLPPRAEVQRHEASRPDVARPQPPRQEPLRHEVQRQEPPRVAALPRTVISQPASVQPAAALPTPNKPITAPAPATKPAEASPAPQQPRSSRRTAMLQDAPQAQPIAATERPASTAAAKSLSEAPASPTTRPFATTTPHWTVGSKAPTVFISKPIEPAKPIVPGAKTESPKPPSESRQASVPAVLSAPPATKPAENLAPIISAAEMRRLPPTDDAPLPQPTAARHEATPAAMFVAEPAPAAKPIDPARQRAGQRRELPGEKFGAGTVASVRLRDGVAMVEFDTADSVPPGSIIRAYHAYAFAARKTVGDLEVIRSEGNVAVAVPHNGTELTALTVGDQAIVLR